jgi:glutathione peroxidase-family protein
MEKQNIYQFKVEDLSGNTFDFSTLKGKKVMIVNTASKCDCSIKIWKRFTKNTKIKFRDHWISG